jgi:coenzyme F420 hydrogenase subunit beta
MANGSNTGSQKPAPSPLAASLARVARGNLCAGCGACAGLIPAKVVMEVASPGFLRPRQTAPLTSEEDERIARTCPGLGQHVEADGRTDHVLWGPHIEMMTGWATDPGLRFAGASGGALSALVAYLLVSGRVDAVVQVAADPARPAGNRTVITASVDEVAAAAGSRYAPSAPLGGLAAHLSEHRATGRRFGLVGKPCDAVALRKIVQEDSEAAKAFPVILSFFCAGVPSHAGGEAVIEALGLSAQEVASFRFRGMGWPGRATAQRNDGSERSMSYQDSWGGILSKHVQHRCKVCADGSGVAADIACADAWETDARGYPLFEEAPGVSLIVARSELGQRILAEALAAGHIETRSFDVAHLAAIQPGQRERRRALFARLLALRLAGRPVPRYEGLKVVPAARENSPIRNARNFLGTLRRILRAR